MGEQNLSEKIIQDTYDKGVLEITKPGTYMRIWQMFALTSILVCDLLSMYPTKGNLKVRKDLHRLLLPRLAKVGVPPRLYTSCGHPLGRTAILVNGSCQITLCHYSSKGKYPLARATSPSTARGRIQHCLPRGPCGSFV